MTADPAPLQLADPGSGLPIVELWIARLMVVLARKTTSQAEASKLIVQQRRALLQIAGTCSPEAGARRVLIKRPLGLEDSSRFWSVYMTLEHLRIVNEGIARIIEELSAGKVPAEATSIAAVKPSPAAGLAAVDGFTRSCDRLAEAEQEIKVTPLRHAHPWFGPLDAHGWHVLAGFHMKLHRGQIATILRAFDE